MPIHAAPGRFDLVINHGRVIDPASGLDAVRHVGIVDGAIAAVSLQPLSGAEEIDARGKVVAPGFIDRNTYLLGRETFRARAADGVTTAFNFEQGAHDVAAAYEAIRGQELINFGFSADHMGARMVATGDPNIALMQGLIEGFPVEATRNRAVTEAEQEATLAILRRNLAAGALAIGIKAEYLPGATHSELFAAFDLAARHRVPVQIHLRAWNKLTDHQDVYEAIAAASITGATVHISHMNASADRYIDRYLDFVARAAARGVAISTECYPYTNGMTEIASSIFDGWESWSDDRFPTLVLPTGVPLTRETFAAQRKKGGFIIFEFMKPEWIDTCVAHPLTQIASDGAADPGGTHPRVAGTNARILGTYVRERRMLSLSDAIRKLSLLPAQTLERAIPQLAKKGRLQPGMDADIVVFDPRTVIDQATIGHSMREPAGIEHVIVRGTPIRRNGAFVDGALPGAAIRLGGKPP